MAIKSSPVVAFALKARRRLRGRNRPAQRGPFSSSTPFNTANMAVSPLFEADHLTQGHGHRLATLIDPTNVGSAELDVGQDDWILGLATEPSARAYPIKSLRRHHLVNDSIEQPFLVTFCAMCGSGICFDPVVDGSRLTFELFGLYQQNMAMRDHQSGTIWSQMSGHGLAGPLAGTTLDMVPSMTMPLSDWMSLHPSSRSPKILGSSQDRTARRQGSDARVVGMTHAGTRLHQNPLVLAVNLEGATAAYPIDPSQRGPWIAEDRVAGTHLSLIAPPGGLPVAYAIDLDGHPLHLSIVDGRLQGGGSSWTFAGLATDGPHRGRRLRYLPSRMSRWSIWSAMHPQTNVRSIEVTPQAVAVRN